MSLIVRNTSELKSLENLKLKMLIYGPSGAGKTMFASTAPNPIIAAVETGHGNGVLTASDANVAFVTPSSYDEMEQFCAGTGFDKYDTIVIDGFSYLTDGIIKDKALTARAGSTPKRSMGILELDDYGVLAELERRLLAKILQLDKHVLVTCLIDYYQPPSSSPPRSERLGGPDLPGSMRQGSAAMFDIVMRLESRSVLKTPGDAKSRHYERVFYTENNGQYLAKNRLRNGKKPMFPSEVVFDLETGKGSFGWFLKEATGGNS